MNDQIQSPALPDVSNNGSLLVPWPNAVSAREFCAEPLVPPPELIKRVLYQSGTMLLSGQSKAKKSWTLIDLALSIASGKPWLGLETSQSPVLYLNFELQDFAFQKRLGWVAEVKGVSPPAELFVLNLRNRLTNLVEIERELPKQIQARGIGAVFLDPLYKISALSSFEENSNDDQAKLLSTLDALCGSSNVALVLAHHFSKGNAARKNQIDRASGGGVYARWPDVFLTLTEHDQEDAMCFEFTQRNFRKTESFVAKWDCPLWRRAEDLNPARLKNQSGANERFPASEALKALSAEGMTYTEWRKATGMSESTFSRKLNDLLDGKKVTAKGNKYFPGQWATPHVRVYCGNSQNVQNSQLNSRDSAPPSDMPTATSFRGGGGGSGNNGRPDTATITHAKSEELPAATTFAAALQAPHEALESSGLINMSAAPAASIAQAQSLGDQLSLNI